MGGKPAVPPSRYSADLLRAFAGGEHDAFLAAGGRPLRPRLARALALADLRPGIRVVDLGCGRGEAATHAARRGARVTALDYSRGSLMLSRATAAAVVPEHAGDGRLGLVAADVAHLPLEAETADRVLWLDVVEHLHPWQVRDALAEVRRILRPGGYVIIHTLPNRWALEVAYPCLRLLVPDLPSEARSSYERAVHVNEQDPRSLWRTLDGAGFSARVWVEEWTTRQAARAGGRLFPDAARARGYPYLARPVARRLLRAMMRTPLRWWVANDIFALAWPKGWPAAPTGGRFRRVC